MLATPTKKRPSDVGNRLEVLDEGRAATTDVSSKQKLCLLS